MSKYANDVQTNVTPQSESIRGRNQVKNNAGGHVFQVDNWTRLERFLILGHEGGTYYATQRKLSFETVDCIDRCLADNFRHTVDTIVQISEAGRAPKNDPAIFALAYVVSKGDPDASSYAMSQIPRVCRIGTHLFDFLNACQSLGKGWGKGFMKNVGAWYDRDPKRLAMQVTKYAQRNGWSHRDVLRKTHFTSSDREIDHVLRYVTQPDSWHKLKTLGPADELLCAVEECKSPDTTNGRRIELIEDYGLVREHLPTESLNDLAIWEALLQNMPLTAMVRNLGKMTNLGLIKPLSKASKTVVNALADTESLKRQRVHPIALLLAMKTYQKGHGVKGSLTWTPDRSIVSALDDAFYGAFDFVEPTGKNFLLGVDVSGSMTWDISGNGLLTCAEGAAAMAMLAARVEKNAWIFGFANSFRDLGITAKDSLSDALRKTKGLTFGSTDCAQPMIYAKEKGLDVDVFCVYTDNETWAGRIHPTQALKQYRNAYNPNAKSAVFGLAGNDFSIADPEDAGQMDFVGFDASAPVLLADFAKQ